MDISVVIPVYGCKAALQELYSRLVKSLNTITNSFEIILVNDSCPQGSWEEIEQLCEKDKRVIGINLSRNFGQIKAITAGLDNVSGEYIVVMDCDLQDRPEEIINLFNKLNEGYDVVFTRRKERKDSFLKKFTSDMFYKMYDYFTGGAYDSSICNYSISRRYVIDNYLKMREQNRAFIIFIKWLGFKQATIDAQHCERYEGKSSYNFKKRFKLASEIITAQSNKPLILSIKVGFTIFILSFIYAIYLVINYFVEGVSISGWTSIIVSLYFLGGILLLNMGVIGLYIGYIFDGIKNRPIYIIRDKIN